ncbi:unnamed protein product [Bursaphelenchus okinawaensis]|uniref:PDZ domain-containing protein n=1 Tax=Bursaphelenchus okinawaensis TaxID=465554 RepID=A0A811KGP5_9BILA|nr:unnamed protein product [Bursaphelenchus okinawaensis]CAG9101921.1 unnamed protein product [Bursaphelenchus okinawaensis]
MIQKPMLNVSSTDDYVTVLSIPDSPTNSMYLNANGYHHVAQPLHSGDSTASTSTQPSNTLSSDSFDGKIKSHSMEFRDSISYGNRVAAGQGLVKVMNFGDQESTPEKPPKSSLIQPNSPSKPRRHIGFDERPKTHYGLLPQSQSESSALGALCRDKAHKSGFFYGFEADNDEVEEVEGVKIQKIVLSKETMGLRTGLSVTGVPQPAAPEKLIAVEVIDIEDGSRIAVDDQLRIEDRITRINGRPVYQMSLPRARIYLHELETQEEPSISFYRPNKPTDSERETPLQYKKISVPQQKGNTSQLHKRLQFTVKKSENGFGFGFASRVSPTDNSNIFLITTVKPEGPAEGILMPGDRILEVNNKELAEKAQPEVVNILRNCPVDSEILFVISRNTDTSDVESLQSNEETRIQIQGLDDGLIILDFKIAVNEKVGAGLGLTIKAKQTRKENGEVVDGGVFVGRILHGSAAFKDGRLKEGDQILGVETVNLLCYKRNSDAVHAFNHTISQMPPSSLYFRLIVGRNNNLNLRLPCKISREQFLDWAKEAEEVAKMRRLGINGNAASGKIQERRDLHTPIRTSSRGSAESHQDVFTGSTDSNKNVAIGSTESNKNYATTSSENHHGGVSEGHVYQSSSNYKMPQSISQPAGFSGSTESVNPRLKEKTNSVDDETASIVSAIPEDAFDRNAAARKSFSEKAPFGMKTPTDFESFKKIAHHRQISAPLVKSATTVEQKPSISSLKRGGSTISRQRRRMIKSEYWKEEVKEAPKTAPTTPVVQRKKSNNFWGIFKKSPKLEKKEIKFDLKEDLSPRSDKENEEEHQQASEKQSRSQSEGPMPTVLPRLRSKSHHERLDKPNEEKAAKDKKEKRKSVFKFLQNKPEPQKSLDEISPNNVEVPEDKMKTLPVYYHQRFASAQEHWMGDSPNQTSAFVRYQHERLSMDPRTIPDPLCHSKSAVLWPQPPHATGYRQSQRFWLVDPYFARQPIYESNLAEPPRGAGPGPAAGDLPTDSSAGKHGGGVEYRSTGTDVRGGTDRGFGSFGAAGKPGPWTRPAGNEGAGVDQRGMAERSGRGEQDSLGHKYQSNASQTVGPIYAEPELSDQHNNFSRQPSGQYTQQPGNCNQSSQTNQPNPNAHPPPPHPVHSRSNSKPTATPPRPPGYAELYPERAPAPDYYRQFNQYFTNGSSPSAKRRDKSRSTTPQPTSTNNTDPTSSIPIQPPYTRPAGLPQFHTTLMWNDFERQTDSEAEPAKGFENAVTTKKKVRTKKTTTSHTSLFYTRKVNKKRKHLDELLRYQRSWSPPIHNGLARVRSCSPPYMSKDQSNERGFRRLNQLQLQELKRQTGSTGCFGGTLPSTYKTSTKLEKPKTLSVFYDDI